MGRIRALLRLVNAVARKRAAAFALCSFCLPALLALAGCREPSAPPGPPYLAIVADLNVLPGVAAPERITYHVVELSGTLNVDRRVSVSPTDTVIMSVPPATYTIELEGTPASCSVRDGALRAIVLSEADNTGLVRYSIQCRGLLNIEVTTDGYDVDPEFVWRVRRTDGSAEERVGFVAANDTLVVNGLPDGPYEVQLAGIAGNCVVISDGGARREVAIVAQGGTTLAFRVVCSKESSRPRVLSFASTYLAGSSVFTFRAVDAERDIDGYVWDLTDCEGNSILPDARERMRRNLRGSRAGGQDTMTVVGAYEVGLPSDSLVGRCTELRLMDLEGNVSTIATHRIGSATGRAPDVTYFDARLSGTSAVQLLLSADDADGDLVGSFVGVRLRDGVLASPDGQPDFGTMDPSGYTGTTLPSLPLSTRIKWDDIYAVVVWVIDARGNARRVEDVSLLP